MSNMPIIDPWLFYWVGVVDAMKVVAILIAVICGAVLITAALVLLADAELHNHKVFLIIFALVTLIFTLIAIFIPSKDTLIYMQTAKLITAENLEWTAESVKQVFDYVVNAISGK